MRSFVEPAVVETLNSVHYFFGHDYLRFFIWRTDGTIEGTYEIQFNGTPHGMEVSDGKLYLSLEDPEYGWELFIINDDGTGSLASARAATDSEVVQASEDDAAFSN